MKKERSKHFRIKSKFKIDKGFDRAKFRSEEDILLGQLQVRSKEQRKREAIRKLLGR